MVKRWLKNGKNKVGKPGRAGEKLQPSENYGLRPRLLPHRGPFIPICFFAKKTIGMAGAAGRCPQVFENQAPPVFQKLEASGI
jgi:hypothetical protein